MLNKFILFLTFILFLGCSKDESVDLSNSINIFQPKNKISYVKKQYRNNSQLENLFDLKEII